MSINICHQFTLKGSGVRNSHMLAVISATTASIRFSAEARDVVSCSSRAINSSTFATIRFCSAKGDAGFVIEDVVGFSGLAAFDGFAPDDDAALCEKVFLANLGHHVPFFAVGAGEGGRDESGADFSLGEVLLVHARDSISVSYR